MNWSVIAGIGIGIPALFILLVIFWAGTKVGWRKVLAHLFLYSCDIGAALVGFTMGFGLEVVSWAWLLIPMILVRFAFYTANQVLIRAAVKEEQKVTVNNSFGGRES